MLINHYLALIHQHFQIFGEYFETPEDLLFLVWAKTLDQEVGGQSCDSITFDDSITGEYIAFGFLSIF